MQKATPTVASPETRLIPLNKLRFDERNARSASDDPARVQADAELVASIKAHGLLENLVVAPRSKTLYGVAAGARRLRALNALAAEQHIPKNHPVPCLVVEPAAAAESSLAENVVRIAMHPADQVVAFSRLAREGATTERIAARFGVAERTVQKRVRLGGLPDEVIDAYREGRINADTATAYDPHQLIDNNVFSRICPFQLLVWLRAAQRGFEGLSGALWNVASSTARFPRRASSASPRSDGG